MNFSLHYSVTYFNNNRFPSILIFSVQLMRLFPKDFSKFHSNAGHYKKEFECSFHSRKTGHA